VLFVVFYIFWNKRRFGFEFYIKPVNFVLFSSQQLNKIKMEKV